uniref:Dolichyl-phosphate beta-glucosyltransferase n=1 Tax=Lynceus sp. MCZ IZ 141354 TaxID=1930659 RepID=A0A9N6WUT5_9CRUS|nr:EOG090X0BIY [Lynceus sp. MCZ IZ 141354]
MLVLIAAAISLCVLALLVWLCMFSSPYARVIRFEDEIYYLNPANGEKEKLPSLDETSSLQLSVIVPAYNEETRLPTMLDECLEFLDKRRKNQPTKTYEVIVVDDGSKDNTCETALKYSAKYGAEKVRVLKLVENRGKGGAVRLGILSSRGSLLLFADADGATTFEDLTKLESEIQSMTKGKNEEKSLAIVCGSRAHLEKESMATRSLFRTFLMKGFHMLVWLFAVRTVRDTQCGFKLLTRQAARDCFPSLHIERWAFDVEMLYIAELLNIPLGEVAVRWTEVDGSKMVPVWSWLQMGRDLVLIWARYTFGAWRLVSHNKVH